MRTIGKTYITLFAFILFSCSSFILVGQESQGPAIQTLSLARSLDLAKTHYPLSLRTGLIENSKEYNLSNISKGYLPQMGITGYATYQSQVFEFPFTLPGISIPSINQDQYKVAGEITQPLTALYTLGTEKEIARSQAQLDQKKLDVDLYTLNDRVIQIYFGILLIQEQQAQLKFLENDIQRNIDKLTIALENGTSLQIQIDVLTAELYKIRQNNIALDAQLNTLIDLLGRFTQLSLSSDTKFEIPSIQPNLNGDIHRPELGVFQQQRDLLALQNHRISNRNLPQLNLFFQGGYGRPGLNPLSNDFNSYYITGIRLQWNLTPFYTTSKSRQLIAIGVREVDVQEETFKFNLDLQTTQQSQEINKLIQLITSDKEIISLRRSIRTTAEKQLELGTLSGLDFLEYINAENKAVQDQSIHEIQLLLATYQQMAITGNL